MGYTRKGIGLSTRGAQTAQRQTRQQPPCTAQPPSPQLGQSSKASPGLPEHETKQAAWHPAGVLEVIPSDPKHHMHVPTATCMYPPPQCHRPALQWMGLEGFSAAGACCVLCAACTDVARRPGRDRRAFPVDVLWLTVGLQTLDQSARARLAMTPPLPSATDEPRPQAQRQQPTQGPHEGLPLLLF